MTTERDIRNQIQFARDKGLEEGMKQGMEKGMATGMENMIESMRKNGIPEELIAKVKAECQKP